MQTLIIASYPWSINASRIYANTGGAHICLNAAESFVKIGETGEIG